MNVRYSTFAALFMGLLVLALVPPRAEAALIEVDLVPGSGDGLLIRDTVNGREWLDVTATTGISPNSALASYGPLGFQLATSADVIQLFTAAGIPDILIGVGNPPLDPGTGGTVANRAPVEALLALMNHAPPYSATAGNPWVHGYTDYGSSSNLTLSRFAAFSGDNLGRANVNTNGGNWSFNTVHSAVGSFLVRATSTVPEPTVLSLLGLGLLGIGFAQRRERV